MKGLRGAAEFIGWCVIVFSIGGMLNFYNFTILLTAR